MKQVDVNTSIEIISTKVSQVCGEVMTLKWIFSCLCYLILDGKFGTKTSRKLLFYMYIFTNNTYTMYFRHSHCFERFEISSVIFSKINNNCQKTKNLAEIMKCRDYYCDGCDNH